MPMNPNIRNWARNDPFSAGHLNEPLPTVRSVRTITGVNGIEVTQTEAGTTIKGPPAPYNGGMGVEHYLATITNAGPDSAADYTDARYWVKLDYVVNGSTYDKIAVNNVVPPKVEIGGGYTQDAFTATVTCTNLSEWISATGTPAGGTHVLPTDGSRLVHVWGFYDVGDTSGNRGHRYVMSETATTDYSVYISGVGTGTDLPAHTGGIYDGYCFKSVSGAGRVVPPTGGISCRIIIDDEHDSATGGIGTGDAHWSSNLIAGSGWGTGRFEGQYTTEATPRMIIHVTGISPSVINRGVIVPFGVTQEWKRDAPYVDPTNVLNTVVGDVAPTVDVQMPSGNKRRFYYDASGRVYRMSAEF